jgi:hydrogenase maturation protease
MIKVLGLGNVLMGDDGFGPAVIHAFEADYAVSDDVEIFDLGTPGLDLMPWLTDADRIVIVDTVKSDLPPGTIRIYDKGDVLRRPPSVRVGPHDPGVKESLLTLEFAGRAPHEVTLVGVVPARTELAAHLSPEVASAVGAAVSAVIAALERGGASVTRRPARNTVVPWWSRSVDASATWEGL